MSRKAENQSSDKPKKRLQAVSRQPVQYFILRAVSIGKKISIEDLVPEVEKMLTVNGETSDRKTKPSYVINRTIKKMADTGILMIEGQEETNYAQLTPNGFKKLEDALLLEQKAVVPMSSNGTFHVVILNFNEDEKAEREKVRYMLKKARFVPLASSAYVTVYPLPHIILRLQEEFPKGRIISLQTAHLDIETSQTVLEQFGMF